MRRAIDTLVGCIALATLSPLLIVVAAAVVLELFGSPLYLAWRVGVNGRKFRMFKFRTMVKGAAREGSITGKNDPRITRLGHVLRRMKVDELPQFLNLLLGDMTLVGPRAESPDIVGKYSPSQMAVLAVKPGITGPGQLEGEESDQMPEGVDPQEYYVSHLMDRKLRCDLDYLRTRTSFSDFRIVLQTVLFILRVCVDGFLKTLRSEPKQRIVTHRRQNG
jgi:lipopolysaccharide/colanic/teichoic acid biosynthesis glycosyltransferase